MNGSTVRSRPADPEVTRSPKVVGHGGPPAASAGRPAVCHRQMTRKGLRGWRALRAPPEERDGCPGPLAVTGRPFSSICSNRPPLPGKQASSSWTGQSARSRSHRTPNVWSGHVATYGSVREEAGICGSVSVHVDGIGPGRITMQKNQKNRHQSCVFFVLYKRGFS